MKQETIEVPKQVMGIMVRHFEILIKDFEKIARQETMRRVDKRLEDIKKGRVRGYSEKHYSEFMKKKGVNVG